MLAPMATTNNPVSAGRRPHWNWVARLATFLCGDDASFLVGQTVVLDGGTVSLMSLISDFRTESTSKFGEDYILGPKKN